MKLHVRYFRGVLLGLTCVSFLLAPAASYATELKKQTLVAWDVYVRTANSQTRERVEGSFLWVDEAPERLQSVRAGKILVSPVGQHNPKPVPSGLIHHWMGAVFIPIVFASCAASYFQAIAAPSRVRTSSTVHQLAFLLRS